MKDTETMGRVTVAAEIESLEDLIMIRRGLITVEQARSVEIADALVDTGATMLSLPAKLIKELDLQPVRGADSSATQPMGAST
jgi:predicted aspartyl protease